MRHVSVLLHTAIDILDLKPGSVAIDATGGSGGHTELMAQRVGKSGQVLAIDQDKDAISRLTLYLAGMPQVMVMEGNFRDLSRITHEISFPKADGILFDLGMSSEQIEESGRGFSFLRDEPLYMTMGGNAPFTAEEIVNTWEEKTLADIIYGYGEDTRARRIAKAIVEARKNAPITSSDELARIVEAAVGGRSARTHPATKTFQALRIAVNDELGALREGLSAAWDIVKNHGVIAVITFHGVEARIVKKFFKEKKSDGMGKLITPHALRPTREETLSNPRARSASLYALKKEIHE